MKQLGLILCAALLAIGMAQPAWADEASKAAKIEEMLKLIHADQLLDQMMAQMKPMMEEQMKKIDVPNDARQAADEMQKRMVDWMQSRLGWDRMKPIYVKIYTETLTEEEIDGSIAFYRTPAGQSILKKMPLIMTRTMSLIQGMLSDMIPEFTKIGEDIEKKYKKK